MGKHDLLKYITDGLVFHLDGADSDGNTWVDRVGNVSYNLTGCSTDGESVIFNTAGVSNGIGSAYVPISPLTGTIEIVLNCESTPSVVFVGESSSIAFWTNGDTIIIAAKNVKAHTFPGVGTGTSTHAFSLCNEYGVIDGEDVQPNDEEMSITSQSIFTSYLGRGSSRESTIAFKGRIFQLRIYNRQLSKAEMRHNQRIDKNKYNI